MPRALLIFPLLLFLGCSPAISENQASTVVSTQTKSKAVSDKIVPKELPILGSSETQLRFKAEDAEAVLTKKPRPTYPATLAVLAGNPPPDVDVCNLSYSAVTKATFDCMQENMNYFQVANTFGFEGEKTVVEGAKITYTWRSGKEGVATIVFDNDKLISKTQVGLK